MLDIAIDQNAKTKEYNTVSSDYQSFYLMVNVSIVFQEE